MFITTPGTLRKKDLYTNYWITQGGKKIRFKKKIKKKTRLNEMVAFNEILSWFVAESEDTNQYDFLYPVIKHRTCLDNMYNQAYRIIPGLCEMHPQWSRNILQKHLRSVVSCSRSHIPRCPATAYNAAYNAR